MICGSLFSGAGLLDIVLEQAGIQHAWFVERDEWRREHLARRWPGVPVFDDVRSVGAYNLEAVEAIVGGFPCKGASTAGKRTGLAHPETALWAEFERIVRELRPEYVAVENVANILALHAGAVWGTVLGDLAALGYDVAWDCIPAAAVGAPHGRDRVFAVAAHAGSGRACHCSSEPNGRRDAWPTALRRGRDASLCRPGGCHPSSADAEREPLQLRGGARDVGGQARGGGGEARQQRDRDAVADRAQAAADATWPGEREQGGDPESSRSGWQIREAAERSRGVAVEWGDYEPAIRRWEAVHGPAPEPLIRRVDDGDAKLRRVRAQLDRQRLSALGDGVHVYVGRLVGEALVALAMTGEDEA